MLHPANMEAGKQTPSRMLPSAWDLRRYLSQPCQNGCLFPRRNTVIEHAPL